MRDTRISDRRRLSIIVGLIVPALTSLAIADELPRPDPEFSPPPVPAFMLRKQDKPITLEEMRRQAEEAEKKVQAQSKSDRPHPDTTLAKEPIRE